MLSCWLLVLTRSLIRSLVSFFSFLFFFSPFLLSIASTTLFFSYFYDDALNVKRSAVEILLHETIGGGFSPPAVAKLHRHARSAASGTDRTRYSTRRKVFSFKSHHSQRISLGIVKVDSRGILDSFGRKANLLSRV